MNTLIRLPGVLTALLCLWVTTGSVLAQTVFWELEPVPDSKLGAGAFTRIGGKTAPAGVHFKLTQNQLQAPLVLTLTATDKAHPVRLRCFKETGDLFSIETDPSGLATRSFRTGEDLKFQLTGDKGASYQLSVWRGPAIILPPASPMRPMSEVTTAPVETQPAATTTTTAVATTQAAGGGGTNSILLGGILVVLVVIAGLMFRGQQGRGRAPLLLLSLSLQAFTATAQEENIDLRPKKVDDAEADARHIEQVQTNIEKFKMFTEGLNKIFNEKFDLNSPIDIKSLEEKGFKGAKVDIASALKTALNLLEAFELIDPREKFLVPDYNPPGLPILPSRAAGDGGISAEMWGEFRDLQDKINKAKTHLEGNYVVLKQTELKTKRLEELTDSAGGFSAIAGLYWAKSKADPNDPMNKSKKGFYDKYDTGQESGLNYLNDALKEFAEFELKHYADRNWYLYFGLPYYNFMVARYVRK